MINTSVNRSSNSLVSMRQPTGGAGRWKKSIVVFTNRSVHSCLQDVVSVSISFFLKHQQIRQLKEEKTHSQQRADQAQQIIREKTEESRGLQQQVMQFRYIKQ